ncbi:hypothetical protein [Nocardioides sambongensis]|uniref:hypothetical protein n=1 Tax=Nocardioides sambongensis TaxID=2589074 RepID=UPI00112B7F3A|nr:hypothetical protein [Nocardioides sambongensis]
MTEPDVRRPGGARRASRSVRISARERRRLQKARRRGGRRALRPSEAEQTPAGPARGGRRALRPRRRRTHGLPGTLGMTFLGAVVPGTGFLYAGRRALGWLVILGWAAAAGGLLWYFGRDWRRALDFAFNPNALKIAAAVLAVLLLVWLGVVWMSYRLVRPRERPRWHTVVGNIAVVVICAVVAAPVLRAAQYALATADLVTSVLDDNATATAPDLDEENPWVGRDRVSVLLLGGDGGDGRDGVRTDSVILLSIDTETGRAVTFSLPATSPARAFPRAARSTTSTPTASPTATRPTATTC